MYININLYRSNSILVVFLFILFISCKNREESHKDKNNNEIAIFNELISSNLFSSTFDVKDSNLFVFLKAQDEYRTSYMYIVNVYDSFVNVEYRLLPSFKETGYNSYSSDTSNFLFYECYKIKLDRILWNKLIVNSQFINDNIVDTIYYMNQGFSIPNYLFWYNKKLLIGHADSKYIENFKSLDSLLYEFIGKKIENRRDNPITKFKDETPLPRSKRR